MPQLPYEKKAEEDSSSDEKSKEDEESRDKEDGEKEVRELAQEYYGVTEYRVVGLFTLFFLFASLLSYFISF